jgi:perosamine synthetase
MTITLPDALAAVSIRMPDPWSTNQVELYERELAQHFGTAEAVAVASGTAALHCALMALGVKKNDEILVSAAATPSSIAPILYLGASPVFVDSGTGGISLDLQDVAAKITERTRAIVAVHLWGRTGDVVRLVEFAGSHGLKVVEDARDAVGSRFDDQYAGTFGELGCMSTSDRQILWSGQGGFVLTDDENLAHRCRAARSHWQTPPPGHQPQVELGHNYALAEPLAAIARFNLSRLDDLLSHRARQSALLTELLVDTARVRPTESVRFEDPNHQYPLFRLELPRPRQFSARLASVGVLNCVGSFLTVAADQAPLFGRYANDGCLRARNYIDSSLAVFLTQQDTDDRIRQIASVIDREARTWAST